VPATQEPAPTAASASAAPEAGGDAARSAAAPGAPAPRSDRAQPSSPPSLAESAASTSPSRPPETQRPGAAPPSGIEVARASPSLPTFHRRVALEDGTVVELGGIAWSAEAPLAYLNGKLYGPGESVAGLEVEAIERERVRLAGGGRKLWLDLR
jgi:hypothetical protein